MEVLVAEREVEVVGDFVADASNRAREIQRVLCPAPEVRVRLEVLIEAP